MRLIHIQRFVQLPTKGGDEDLVYFVFHDNIWQPPALRPLDAVSDVDADQPGNRILKIGGITHLLPLDLLACLCLVTELGETEAATLAFCDVKAVRTGCGTGTAWGKEMPSAHKTLIVSKPERKRRFSRFPSGFPGVGVVERYETSSALRLVTDDFFPLSQDI